MAYKRIRSLIAGTLVLALTVPVPVLADSTEEPDSEITQALTEQQMEEQSIPEDETLMQKGEGNEEELNNGQDNNIPGTESSISDENIPQDENRTQEDMIPEDETPQNVQNSSESQNVQPKSAGWVQSGNRWWYQNADGSYPAAQWQMIDGFYYYFDAEGWMTTGWQYVDGYWYYLDEQGRMTSGWKYLGGNWYYLNASGVMQTGMVTVGQYTYYMNEQGAEQFGWVQTGGVYDYYYFDFPSGRMVTGWKYIDNKWYYFASDGKMQYGWRDIDGYRYYLGPSGAMLTGWQYLGSYCYYFNTQGHMLTGWQKIDGVQYYLYADGRLHGGWLTLDATTYYFHADGSQAFDEWVGNQGVGGRYINKYGKLVKNGTYSIGGSIYTFDANGFCTSQNSRYVTATDPLNGKTYKLESQYVTDPQLGTDVTQEEFLAAVLYTEAGNQGLAGQVAVGLVLLNRMESSSFPSSLNFVVYQSSQFEVARNGTLTKYLKAFRDNDQNTLQPLTKARSLEAAKTAVNIMENRKKTGAPRTVDGITLPNGKTDFDYLYFMTPSAFSDLGLNQEKCDSVQYNGHIFFKYWVK